MLVALGGCVAREGDSAPDYTSSTGTGSTTDGSSELSETGAQEVDARFFGWFHAATVGFVNDGSMHGWSNIEIRPDGHFVYYPFICTSAADPVELTWKVGADPDALELELEPNDGEIIRFGYGKFSAVKISLAPDCGELVIEYTWIDDSPFQFTYSPGRVCAQGSDCEFELAWCDGEPSPVCSGG